MKKINLTTSFKDLEGKDMLTDRKSKDKMMMNKIVANILSIAKATKDPVRQLDISLKIYNAKKEIELDDSDIDLIKKVIQESNLSSLIAGQIIKVLDKKEEKKK